MHLAAAIAEIVKGLKKSKCRLPTPTKVEATHEAAAFIFSHKYEWFGAAVYAGTPGFVLA